MAFSYNDGLVKAWEVLPGWIAIEWLYPGDRPVAFALAVRKIWKVVKANGFKGWLCYSEKDHENMHKHIEKMGGKRYAEDAQRVFFKKEVN